VAKRIYGADGVDYAEQALEQIDAYAAAGFGNLPVPPARLQAPLVPPVVSPDIADIPSQVCMAKTQFSLSCDASAKGVPQGFRITVQEVRASVGAGFLVVVCGDIKMVPGLPTRPGFYDVDLDLETGRVIGLF
jgi:formyltetrahydrofolate synthetase